MAEATPDSVADGYARELRREILRSEIQRVQVLAVVLAVLLVCTMLANNLATDLVRRIFRNGLAWWEPLATIGPFALYEFIVLFVLRWRASRDSDFPRYARFANAFIETSLPSVIIFVLSHHMEPTTVFSFWPPMLYFVFIVLSTLRLDFWLSLWTGAVAAVQQMVLVLWLLPIVPWGNIPDAVSYTHLTLPTNREV